jgi:uncharacterized membrane protein
MKETDPLHALAVRILTRLGVPFTKRALRNIVDTEYSVTMRGGTISAQVRRALAIIDRRDATNRLIVLCKVLRRYHVRHVIGETPERAGVHVVAADTLTIAETPPAGSVFAFFYANEWSEEPGYASNVRTARLLTAGSIVAAAIVVITLATRAPSPFALAGLLISAFLVAYELNPKVSAWAASHGCEHGKIKMSCSSVLKSRASRLFGVISLADIGVVYFAAELFQRAPSWYTLAPLPLSLFAIRYQAIVVKAWCPFCLLIHAVLWIQAAVLFGQTGSVSILTMVVAAVILYLTRRVVRLKTHARALELQHQHWIRDGELFKKLFDVPAVTSHAQIIAVLSPKCQPCKSMQRKLAQLNDWFDGRIAITMLFTDGPPAHRDWITKHRITITPTLFFNGRAVPDEFHDLTLLGEMIEDHWLDAQLVEGVA